MGKEFRKGENIANAQKRWRLERRQQEAEKRRQIEGQKRLELKENEERILRKAKSVIMPPPIPYILGNKKLSILICSIKGRERLLQNLVDKLKEQTTNEVEILIEIDSKEITIGAKRNILLKRARGDYICFIDDDDRISKDYIAKILEAIKSNPDCCSLKGHLRRKVNQKTLQLQRIRRRREELKEGGIRVNIFIHSLKYKTWFEKDGIYYRCPNHLNTVKRELALQVGFPDIMKGEDLAYSFKLLLLLKVEAVIEGVIYFYIKA